MFFFTSNIHIDSSIIHGSAKSYLNCGRTPLGACSRREQEKIDSKNQLIADNGDQFYPFVLESYGAVGTYARKFLAILVEEAASNGIHSLYGMKMMDYLLRSVSICLQNGNGHILSSAAKASRRSRVRRM